MYKSKKWAHIFSLSALGLFSLSVLSVIIPQQTVFAAGSEKYSWRDKLHIAASEGRYKSETFFTHSTGDGARSFQTEIAAVDTSGCSLKLNLVVNESDPSKGQVSISPFPSIGGNTCSSDIASLYTGNVTIGNTGKSGSDPFTDALDTKKQEIISVVPEDNDFPATSDTITLHEGGESGKVIGTKKTTTEYKDSGRHGFTATFDNLKLRTKYTACSKALGLCTEFTRQSDGIIVGKIPTTFIEAVGIDRSKTCESEGDVLAWVLCPVLKILDKGIDSLSAGVESLLEVDESKYTNDSLVTTWRTFRNIALLILVPMMMLMVIGTALEFGPFDAYTVKKALPRMMLAVMFITLSLSITHFFINISNVVGRGIEGIVLSTTDSPASLSEAYSGAGGSLFTLAAAGGIAGVAATGTADIAFGLIGSLALVTFLALLIGYIILVLRELLILVLMLVAPLAILVWIFPDNDKLWKIWKATFIALLMMFPLIMLLIASGKVFAGVIGETENGFTAFFLKIIALIAPFFFIPATFKYGLGVFGNIAGMVNDRSRGIFDKQRKKREGLRAMGSERVGRRVVAKRADWTSRLQEGGSSGNWVKQRAFRTAAAGLGGYNIHAQASARQAAVAKEFGDQINTGDDTEIRALNATKGSDGVWRSLAGKEVNEASVTRARKRWGNDVFAQQASLSYEMRKASSEDEAQRIANNYGNVAKNVWRMSDNQATGAWIGSAFENQNQHLEYKNMRLEKDADGKATGRMKMDSKGYKTFVNEVYEKRGSYNLAQMGSNTVEELNNAYAGAVADGDTNTQQRIQAIAETFMHNSQYGAAGGDGEEPLFDPSVLEANSQVNVRGQRGGEQQRMINTPGAAHVAERVRKLAETTGVLRRPTTGIYAPRESGKPHAPSTDPRENTREQ